MQWKGAATILVIAAAALTLALRIHARTATLRHASPLPRTFPTAMPPTILWAWEEPEDLTTLGPARTGVAYLAESLTLADTLTIRPRFQPLHVAPGTSVMAVVRIETARIQTAAGFRDTPALRTATVEALLKVAQQPNLRAFQIDFDATRSQRPFYAAILQQLRPRMPAAMPLSITALLSWCAPAHPGSKDDWLAGLPIDEAVPMFFRIGGHSKPTDSKLGYPITEPRCRTSAGVSTDETWPTINPTQRLYIFAPHPWTIPQLSAINTQPTAALLRELTP